MLKYVNSQSSTLSLIALLSPVGDTYFQKLIKQAGSKSICDMLFSRSPII